MKNKQVFKNTLMLYIRQIIVIIVSLYTIRIVLNQLGVEDFGIYSVIASIVTMCSFLSGTLASATQRFFSYALGKNDVQLLKQTFSTTLLLYFIICILCVLILEVIGIWYIKEHLVLPGNRIDSALFLYHISIVTFVFTIVNAPLMAIIIAHEDMYIFAFISIFEAVLKLTSVFILSQLLYDKLELYGVLQLLVSFLISATYLYVCMSKYKECQFREFYGNKTLLKKICLFTGWTLYGQASTIAREQGVTILLNQYFNPTVVASRAISINVSNQVNTFAQKFNTGLYPPIIKSYASDDKKELYSLVVFGSKISYLLMWVFTLPIILKLPHVLDLWLGEYPSNAILFIKLSLIESLILALGLTLATAARAPGKMMIYELPLGSIQFIILLTSYLCLNAGYEAVSVFYIAIIANIIMFMIRLFIVSKLVGLLVVPYLKDVIFPLLVITTLSLVFSYAIGAEKINSMLHDFFDVVAVTLFVLLISFQFALDENMKKAIKSKIKLKLFNG